MFRIRLRAIFAGANVRICTAFWLFGLINNVLYVIILTAALDLVGPNVPKGVVLLADVIPSFLMKLCAPYFIHAVPYSVRVILFVIISTGGMLLVALTPPYIDGGTIGTKMAGVVLASTSSGLGELSFLGLTHFYGPFSLAAWGSGTGGAGLIGAGAYALATSYGVGITNTLLASCLLPIIMLGSFFIILPRQPLKHTANATKEHSRSPKFTHVDEDDEGDPRDEDPSAEGESLLRQSIHSTSTARTAPNWQARFLRNLRRSRSLFFPL
ncbi:G1/S-specific cyclin cln3 [Lobaria immixta]|nr:G1/S-specific cyclin cln3 [Lobaria immixta]